MTRFELMYHNQIMSIPEVPVSEHGWVDVYASDEEIALAASLRALDAELEAELAAAWGDDDATAGLASSDEELLARLSGPVHEADLLLLASIDPVSLRTDGDRLRCLTILDKVAALVASKQSEVLAAIGGATPSGAYLDEVHLEHCLLYTSDAADE